MYRKRKQFKLKLSLFKTYSEFSGIVCEILNISAKNEINTYKTITTYIIKAKIYNDIEVINLISLYPYFNPSDAYALKNLFKTSKNRNIKYVIIEINNVKF
jgi:hypothetical protein